MLLFLRSWCLDRWHPENCERTPKRKLALTGTKALLGRALRTGDGNTSKPQNQMRSTESRLSKLRQEQHSHISGLGTDGMDDLMYGDIEAAICASSEDTVMQPADTENNFSDLEQDAAGLIDEDVR